jgi:hypothetical protein
LNFFENFDQYLQPFKIPLAQETLKKCAATPQTPTKFSVFNTTLIYHLGIISYSYYFPLFHSNHISMIEDSDQRNEDSLPTAESNPTIIDVAKNATVDVLPSANQQNNEIASQNGRW